MDITIKIVYIDLMYLKNKDKLDCVGIYNYVNYGIRAIPDLGHIYRSPSQIFIKKYFNTKQDGFEFYMD